MCGDAIDVPESVLILRGDDDHVERADPARQGGRGDDRHIDAGGDAGHDERYGVALNALTPIPEQVDRLAGRVAGLLRLRRLDPAEARVAIIGYNYPAGESRLLGGSFLDVAASMSAVLAELGFAADEVKALGF